MLYSDHLSFHWSALFILCRHSLLKTWWLIQANWLSKRRERWLLSVHWLTLWWWWWCKLSLHEWLVHLLIVRRWRRSHWWCSHLRGRIEPTSVVIIHLFRLIWRRKWRVLHVVILLEIWVFYRLHFTRQ